MKNENTYTNVYESIFGRGSEKAADYAELSRLAMKYSDEVQLFFGTASDLRYLKELKLLELERNGVKVVRD